MTSSKGSIASLSIQDADLPLRPAYSQILEGEGHFVLRTNYFGVNINTEKELIKYDIEIEPVSNQTPAVKNGRKRRQIFKMLFKTEPDFQALGEGVATDYANTLITCGRLHSKTLPRKVYKVPYRNETEELQEMTNQDQPVERMYRIILTFAGLVRNSELIRYIDSLPNDPGDFDTRQEAIQAMNIIVAGSPNKNDVVFQAGQNKFFQYTRGSADRSFSPIYDKWDLGQGLIAVRGYFSSIRTSTSRILLNLNAQCSAFYPEINLGDLMDRFVGGDLAAMWKLADLEQFIRKLRVTTEQLTREGKMVTREKTVWGFSHKYEQVYDSKGNPVFHKDGKPKMKGTKGALWDYGDSNSITFSYDTKPHAKLFTVSAYFSECESYV